jgi:quercetin dioxygenase-like cupin family protein
MFIQGQFSSQSREEAIVPGNSASSPLSDGVHLREFVNAGRGAKGFSTGIVSFAVGALLSYHRHPISEAIIVLTGTCQIAVEGRRYLLQPLDCLHVPAERAHEVRNPAENSELVALSAFASDLPTRSLVQDVFELQVRDYLNPAESDPEHIVRFNLAERYEPSAGTRFVDLFASRFGSVGICGGYGRFDPGSSLPCHTHQFDESISIIEGEAVCRVQGNRYQLRNCDTAFVPEGRPHRFLNLSKSQMAMIWVYAGNEPERTLVSPGYCDGSLSWP